MLISPEDLGPKGDLNDWLRVGAKGDPGVFRSLLERALATSSIPGRSRSSGYHRTWRPGIWRTIPACVTSYASWPIRNRSAAMRTCDSWRSGTGWHLLLSRKRPAN